MEKCIFRTVSLERDLDFLYELMVQDEQALFSTPIFCNTIEKYRDWLNERLNKNFNDFNIVEVNGDSIGYVHTYDFSMQNGHCKMVVNVHKKYQMSGIGGIVAIQFMKKLFNQYPIRKIYLDIYDYNTLSYQSNLRAGFIEEATLEGYRYYDGAYHSLHVLAMSRERYFNTLGRLM